MRKAEKLVFGGAGVGKTVLMELIIIYKSSFWVLCFRWVALNKEGNDLYHETDRVGRYS